MNALRIIKWLLKTKNDQKVPPPASDLNQIDPATGEKSYPYYEGTLIERLAGKKYIQLGNPSLILNAAKKRIEIYNFMGREPKIYYISDIGLEPEGLWSSWKKLEKISFHWKNGGKEIRTFDKLINPDELIAKFRIIEENLNGD